MIILDRKKAMMTIMAKRHPKDGSVTSAPMASEKAPEDGEGHVDGRHAAMQDFLAGIHEKSPQKMMEAMANFHDLHMAANDATPEVPEQPEKES